MDQKQIMATPHIINAMNILTSAQWKAINYELDMS